VAAARLWKPLALVCVVPAAIVIYEGSKFWHMVTTVHHAQAQARLMGHYLREVMPADAAVVSFVHGTAVAYYTGRPIVRFDLTPQGGDAQALIERLSARRYRPVLVVDRENEGAFYEAVFRGTPYEKPAWPARASFSMPGSSTLWYFDLTDRDRAPDRIPPLDVVR
jgi:hypothetical protein